MRFGKSQESSCSNLSDTARTPVTPLTPKTPTAPTVPDIPPKIPPPNGNNGTKAASPPNKNGTTVTAEVTVINSNHSVDHVDTKLSELGPLQAGAGVLKKTYGELGNSTSRVSFTEPEAFTSPPASFKSPPNVAPMTSHLEVNHRRSLGCSDDEVDYDEETSSVPATLNGNEESDEAYRNPIAPVNNDNGYDNDVEDVPAPTPVSKETKACYDNEEFDEDEDSCWLYETRL